MTRKGGERHALFSRGIIAHLAGLQGLHRHPGEANALPFAPAGGWTGPRMAQRSLYTCPILTKLVVRLPYINPLGICQATECIITRHILSISANQIWQQDVRTLPTH